MNDLKRRDRDDYVFNMRNDVVICTVADIANSALMVHAGDKGKAIKFLEKLDREDTSGEGWFKDAIQMVCRCANAT